MASHRKAEGQAPYVSLVGTQALLTDFSFLSLLFSPLAFLFFFDILDTGDVLPFALTVIRERFISRPHSA